MRTYEKIGVLSFLSALFCCGYIAYFATGENQFGFLALLAFPILGIAGVGLLLKSPNFKKPLLIFLVVGFACLAISNFIDKF